MYDTDRHLRSFSSEEWSYYGYFITVKPFLTATFLEIAVSRDFCVFWILKAVRCKSKETIVEIKIVYDTNKHFRGVSCEKWSRCGYFITVKPFLTARFLEIAVSRDFCVFWVLETAWGKLTETLVRIKVVYDKYKHFRSGRYEKWSYYGYLIAR